VASMGKGLGERALRIAIKDRAGNERVFRTVERILSRVEEPRRPMQSVAIGL
jgi:histidinol-phosphate/aromatic aminotransferase/cobyric acid decarboxylase-like protein